VVDSEINSKDGMHMYSKSVDFHLRQIVIEPSHHRTTSKSEESDDQEALKMLAKRLEFKSEEIK
jgi:hypothetical protein